MEALITKLSNEYKANPNDEKFADRAKREIAEHKPTTRTTGSKLDPERLQSQAVALSKLKKLCMAFNIYHPDIDKAVAKVGEEFGDDDKAWQEWDAAKTLPELVKLQKQWRGSPGLKGKLAQVPTVPPVLMQLKLSRADHDKVVALRQKSVNAKLATSQKIDVDALLRKLMPGLTKTTFDDVVPALLLATGRRSVEILKTAKFTPISEYKVFFEGQVKKVGEVKYEIDLLAPADLCIKALTWVRENVDCKTKTTEEINAILGRKLNRAVAHRTSLKPHDLRAVNAVACEKLYNKRKSFIGYIQSQLGHDNETSAPRYQRFKVQITRPWNPHEEVKETKKMPETKEEIKAVPEEEEVLEFGIKYWSKPSRARAAYIVDAIKNRKYITADNIRKAGGGSIELIKRVIQNNKAIIDAHNAALDAAARRL